MDWNLPEQLLGSSRRPRAAQGRCFRFSAQRFRGALPLPAAPLWRSPGERGGARTHTWRRGFGNGGKRRGAGPGRGPSTIGRCARCAVIRCRCVRAATPPFCGTSGPGCVSASRRACGSTAWNKGSPEPPAPTPQAPPPAVAPPTERYRPRPRSAPYILLVALLRSNDPLPEAELLRVAPPLCAHPITAPGGALSTLIRRDLVRRHGRPPRYSLTERGRLLAQRLAESAEAPPLPEHPAPSNPAHTAMPSDSPAPSGDHAPASPAPSEDSAPSEDRARSPSPGGDPEGRVELRPGRFEVVLCADVTEGSGPGRSRGALPPLQAVGQRVELRRLPVGDFLWVARETDPPPGRPPHELVLDVVVERKTAADLCQSLSDGRYREQKWRLRRCGLSLPVFLLEGLGGAQQLPLPTATLRQAAASNRGSLPINTPHKKAPLTP
eukprot:XP_025001287.1 crossover junction endonuclease MUS81 [Gallus gallus]